MRICESMRMLRMPECRRLKTKDQRLKTFKYLKLLMQKKNQTTTEDKHPEMRESVVKRPSQWRAFWSLTKYATLAAARNKATLAFGFIFPIAFVSVFGLLGNTDPTVSIGVDSAIEDSNPIVQALENIEIVELQRNSEEALQEQVEEGDLAGFLRIEEESLQPPRYEVALITSDNPTTSATTASVVRGVVDNLNLRLAGVDSPSISLSQEQLPGSSGRYIDFALPGMIGFAMLSTAIFGTVFGLIFLKKTLVLKRMFATPTLPLTFLLAQGSSRLIWAVLQTAVIVAFGVLVFDFSLAHGWLTFVELLIVSAIGLVAFLGFGFFMAGLANDENSANPLVNLVTLPQFLLSGVFFPTDSFPDWVQPIANNLPLSYFNQSMRDIASEGAHLIDVWPYLLGMLAWGGVMYLLAARTFKWE